MRCESCPFYFLYTLMFDLVVLGFFAKFVEENLYHDENY